MVAGFHGTVGNPVYDYAMSLNQGSSTSTSTQQQGQQRESAASSSSAANVGHARDAIQPSEAAAESAKDYTDNADGGDPR